MSAPSGLFWMGISIAALTGSTPVATAGFQKTGAPRVAEELREHVRQGELEVVEKLLSTPDVDPNAQDGKGWNALMYAAHSDKPQTTEMMALLLKAGVDLDRVNGDGETALIVATKRGNVEAARQLLMAGASVAIEDRRGRTALAWAEEDHRTYLSQIIRIASRPSGARVTVAERPADTGGKELVPPRVVKELPPLYTESAFNRGVEGRVVLKVIVRKDGSIGPIRVDQSLERELDDAAIEAVRTWQFEPATVSGEAINVLANVEIDFIIHHKKGDSET